MRYYDNSLYNIEQEEGLLWQSVFDKALTEQSVYVPFELSGVQHQMASAWFQELVNDKL